MLPVMCSDCMHVCNPRSSLASHFPARPPPPGCDPFCPCARHSFGGFGSGGCKVKLTTYQERPQSILTTDTPPSHSTKTHFQLRQPSKPCCHLHTKKCAPGWAYTIKSCDRATSQRHLVERIVPKHCKDYKLHYDCAPELGFTHIHKVGNPIPW